MDNKRTLELGGGVANPFDHSKQKITTTMLLPSGATIDVDRPDFNVCRTVEDYHEIKYALSEKIIDIELQIDMFETGAGVANGRAYAADWLPRTRAALKWAKLYRDEAQNRQGRLASIEKARVHHSLQQNVIEILHALLSKEQFTALIEAAEALKEHRHGEPL